VVSKACFLGDIFTGLILSLSAIFFSGDILKADCGTPSSELSGLLGVEGMLGAIFSRSSLSICDRNGEDGGLCQVVSTSSSIGMELEVALSFSGESVDIGVTIMHAKKAGEAGLV